MKRSSPLTSTRTFNRKLKARIEAIRLAESNMEVSTESNTESDSSYSSVNTVQTNSSYDEYHQGSKYQLCAESVDRDWEHNINHSSEDEDQETEQCYNLISSLREWALDCRITHLALSKLLQILKPKHPELPIDARTLLNTPKTIEIRDLGSGLYWDAGLLKTLSEVCKYKECPKKLLLEFSIDGLPISKTSKAQFWPIQCSILNVNIRPRFVGIFCGNSKPKSNGDEFVEPFLNECGVLINQGITISGKSYEVKFDKMIADAPARAMLKCITGHNGYNACERCTVEGTYYSSSKHVCLVETNAPLRTDESFRAQEQEGHHHSHSPFEQLPIDMVHAFPLDYLHLVLLGVMKTLLGIWRKGTSVYETYFSSNDIAEISVKLLRAAKTKPSDINRAVRGLETVGHWTGTEYRTFLLKTGPIVLKDHLPLDAYNHFLALHCAITICTSEPLLPYLDVAETLLKEFVLRFGEIYGNDMYVYNIHSLIHITDDVRRFGVLDIHSAFKYESNLGILKRLLRSGNKPLQQVANRIQERQFHELTKPKFEPKYPVIKNMNKNKNTWQVLEFKNFYLNSTEGNCWILTKENDIVQVEYFSKNNEAILIHGTKLQKKYRTNLYDLPLSSSRLSIYKSKLAYQDAIVMSLEQFYCKLFRIEIDGSESSFFPLFHTSQ